MGTKKTVKKKRVSIDKIIAMFQIKTNPDKFSEVWYKDSVIEPMSIVGLSHSNASEIIIIFRKT